jgi:hypothetical protein
MHTRTASPAIRILLALGLALLVGAEETGMSLNSQITVVPAPGVVTIDGDSADWDLSAGVWSYNNPVIVDKFSVWTHLMWDQKGVYFLARFADTTPLANPTMGKDFGQSWRNDCFQARVIFDDRQPDEHQMHVNLFYSATEAKPYMLVHHGGFGDPDTGPERKEQTAALGSTMEKAGGTVAFRKWANGKGYNCEAFWPWSYCRTGGKPLAVGEQFTFGIEALWSNSRLADGIKHDKVNRIFMFRARNGWGSAVISGSGRLQLSAEQQAIQAARLKAFVDYGTYGSIPLTYRLPGDGVRDVTIAIDDAVGRRVRNLFGQHPRSAVENTELWDGLDDDGKPVAPGTYTVAIVDHKPVETVFVNSVYNAGTPPWKTEGGRKLWGSNHGCPTTIATRKDTMLVGFTGVEGATGLLRADGEAVIQWTDSGEVADVALDERRAYALSPDSWIQQTVLRRFDLATGRTVPFDDAKKSVHAVLPLAYQETAITSSLAISGGTVYVLLVRKDAQPGNQLLGIDAATGEVRPVALPAGDLVAITARDDVVYGLLKDGTVQQLDPQSGATKHLFTAADLGAPVRLALSQDGTRFAVSDQRSNQVRVFDRGGARIASIGQPYAAVDHMRPAGAFNATDLIAPLGLAFDVRGRLWIAEAAGSCRRVTTWMPAATGYRLGEQYWGGADYGAMGGFPITFDSSRFIAHGIEFALDPEPKPALRPTREQALVFHPHLAHEQRGLVYRFQGREYAVTTPGYNGASGFMIAKRDGTGVFTPCIKVQFGTRKLRDGQWLPVPGSTWIDRNDDGREEPGEIATGFTDIAAYWSSGWTRPDLTIITHSLHVYRPQGFTPGGVPLYDFAKPEKPANIIPLTPHEQGSTGTLIMDDAGNLSDGIRFHTVSGRQGKYPNRFGRHDAPAAQRGVLIAPFRTNGVVEAVPGVGAITALGGDRGEWFLMTMDGIYLSSILQDSKGDITMDETFTGQESFGGFLWKDEKGRILAQLGGPSYLIVEIKGLESTRRQSLTVSVTQAQIEAGRAIAERRKQAAGVEPGELAIARLAALPSEPVAVDLAKDQPLLPGASTTLVAMPGDASRWFRTAMAHDGSDLAVLWQVVDQSPWKNGSTRFTHAFIGGDCVDLKLDVPGRGPLRLLVAPLGGTDTVVYSQAKAANQDAAVTYMVGNNPANATNLAVVKTLASARVQSKTGMNGYSVLLRVPLAELGLEPGKTPALKGTVGVIYSDPLGANRVARMYWFDKATDLVSDVPSEARLAAERWGPVRLMP